MNGARGHFAALSASPRAVANSNSTCVIRLGSWISEAVTPITMAKGAIISRRTAENRTIHGTARKNSGMAMRLAATTVPPSR